jgi:hypothetical protein
MASENGTISFIAGALIVYLFVSNSSETIQEKTFYFQSCSDYLHSAYSCPTDQYRVVTTTTYKVFIDRQMIVEKSRYPTVYKSCVIFDKDNWNCEKEYGQTISVTEGKIYLSHGGSVDEEGKNSPLPRYDQINAVIYYILATVFIFRN